MLSPLTEGRGLKLRRLFGLDGLRIVAPHGGAWIETTRGLSRGLQAMSPLTEGRGLKRHRPAGAGRGRWSPLTEGRGLKHYVRNDRVDRLKVAPHGGAWIETRWSRSAHSFRWVAPHGGAWIETTEDGKRYIMVTTSPLTEGRGLKLLHVFQLCRAPSRPSRRGVD